jgi:hypothetical protein
VGKHVNSPGGVDERNKETMQVPETADDAPLLYVEMDGQKYGVYRRRPVGFVS